MSYFFFLFCLIAPLVYIGLRSLSVYSRDDLGYWRDALNHVLARTLREGIVFYERR